MKTTMALPLPVKNMVKYDLLQYCTLEKLAAAQIEDMTPAQRRAKQIFPVLRDALDGLTEAERRVLDMSYLCRTPVPVEVAADVAGIGVNAAYAAVNRLYIEIALAAGYVEPKTKQ